MIIHPRATMASISLGDIRGNDEVYTYSMRISIPYHILLSFYKSSDIFGNLNDLLQNTSQCVQIDRGAQRISANLSKMVYFVNKKHRTLKSSHYRSKPSARPLVH